MDQLGEAKLFSKTDLNRLAGWWMEDHIQNQRGIVRIVGDVIWPFKRT